MSKSRAIKPQTRFSLWIYGGDVALMLGFLVFMWLLFPEPWGFPLGLVLGFLCLGFMVPLFTETVPGYHARIMLNEFTKTQRVLFQGFHFVLPWESKTANTDLRREVMEVRGRKSKDEEGEPETYPTKDGLVWVKYTYMVSPDASDPNTAEENVLTWSSFEPDAIKTSMRALISQGLRDFFRNKTTEEAVQKAAKEIQAEVFPDDDIIEAGQKFGGHAEFTLEDLDRDPALQAARDAIGRSTSYGEAIKAVMDAAPGLSVDRAADFIELENFPNAKQLRVRGLENATYIGGLWPMGGHDDHGSGHGKKGGKH